MDNCKVIATSDVRSTPRRDGQGVNYWQACALSTGRAFPAPFDHWIESPDKAVAAGEYPVLGSDLVVKNNDLVLDKRAVFGRRPLSATVLAAPKAVKSA